MASTPSIKLYSMTPYDRGAKARWLLTEMGIPFETHLLDREKKENEAPAYLKINPMGRVPSIEIDGQSFFESAAICEYLCDRFADKGLAPQPGSPDRGRYLQWMYFVSSMLDTAQTRIMIIEDIPPGEIYDAKLGKLQEDIRDAFHTINLALSYGPYLMGSRFTAADACAGYHLYFLRMWPELDGVLQDFPRVIEYLERLKAMPSAVKSQAFSFPA
jgi:glutathione S-transferase